MTETENAENKITIDKSKYIVFNKNLLYKLIKELDTKIKSIKLPEVSNMNDQRRNKHDIRVVKGVFNKLLDGNGLHRFYDKYLKDTTTEEVIRNIKGMVEDDEEKV